MRLIHVANIPEKHPKLLLIANIQKKVYIYAGGLVLFGRRGTVPERHSKFQSGDCKMLYTAIKTLHLTQWNYPNGDQCEHDWTCCAMFASWFVSKTHSKFWHGRDNLLHIAAKIPACVWYYPHGNQCDHIVLCLHHGLSTQLILNFSMGETKCCI